jgi:hypothetical protein
VRGQRWHGAKPPLLVRLQQYPVRLHRLERSTRLGYSPD